MRAAELISLIGDALRRDTWRGPGIRSPEHWVTHTCGVSPARARRLVTMARALPRLPVTTAAFAAGRLTEDQTAVIVRYADETNEAEIAGFATLLTVPQLSRLLPAMSHARRAPTSDEPPAEDGDRGGSGGAVPLAGAGRGGSSDVGHRSVTMDYADDGGFWCSIRLPADEGALLERALIEARRQLAAADARYVDTGDLRAGWADAVVRTAEAALSALDTVRSTARPPGERTQVVVHLDADAKDPLRLHLGPALPDGIAEFMSCDATVRYLLLSKGRPLAQGRRRRTVSPFLRTVIEGRDQGCRAPGCGHRRWLHVHHIVHWSRGGRTDPDNLIALCSRHHRMVHTGALVVIGDPEEPTGLQWFDERGHEVLSTSRRPPSGPQPSETGRRGMPDRPRRRPAADPAEAWWIRWN